MSTAKLEKETRGKKDNKKQKVEESGAQINEVNLAKDTKDIMDLNKTKEDKAGKVKVEFEYVTPSEPYFHIVRTLLNQFLDGEAQEKLDISGMADNVLDRASIGSVIASSLGDEDPDKDPRYEGLNDDQF